MPLQTKKLCFTEYNYVEKNFVQLFLEVFL